MKLRDIEINNRPLRDVSGVSGDAQPPGIDAWMDVFERLLRVPNAQRTSILEELRGHLTERTRDLMLRGVESDTALRQAINELGDAAELAKQFCLATRYPRRKLIMNTLFAGAGTIAVITSIAVMTNGGQHSTSTQHTPAMYMEAEQEQRVIQANLLGSIVIDVVQDMTAREIVNAIVATKKVGVSVNWDSIGYAEFDPDEPLGLSAQEVSVLTVLREINRRSSDGWDTIEWRLENHVLIIDRREVFDRRELELVSYDINETLHNMFESHDLLHEEATEQIAALIYQMVEPELWEGNGGDIAQLQMVGGKMFVQAPMRMQEKVQWILSELENQPTAHALGNESQEPSVMPTPAPMERLAHE